MRWQHKSYWAVLTAAIWATAAVPVASAQTPIFQTGFEPPSYTTGNLAGQNGWNGYGLDNAVVQTTIVHNGSQAVAMDATGSTTAQAFSYTFPPQYGGVVTLEAFFQQSALGNSSYWVIGTFGNDIAQIGEIVIGPGYLTPTRGVWNDFKEVFDFNNHTATTYLNGNSVSSGPISATATAVGEIAIGLVQGGGTDQGYFDDISLSSNLNPLTITKSFSPSQVVVGASSTLTYTVTNPNPSTAASNIQFSDVLGTGLAVASTPNFTSNCSATAPGATSGSGSLTVTIPSLAANTNCTISLTVTASTRGLLGNTTSLITANLFPAGIGASGTLTAVAPPSISKSFGATAIPIGGSTSLSFTISNPVGNPVTLTGVGFTDSLPAGLAVSNPNGLTGSCGGGTITASPGSTSVSLSGAALAQGVSCAFSVNVDGTSPAGAKTNTVQVTSTEGGPGNTAMANVTVVAPPTITKAFGAGSILLNGSTSLTFTISNPNSTTGLTGVLFSDSLPSGLVVATPNGLSANCGGTATANPGSSMINLSGGSLSGGAYCTITLNVKGTTAGAWNNTTGAVSSTNGGTGSTSNTATLTVVAPPTISKAFGATTIPLNGETSLIITVTNPNTTTTLTGVGFTDNLPSGLQADPGQGVSSNCAGGFSFSATSPFVSAATIPAGGSCELTVYVIGMTAGVKNNTTTAVTSNEGGTGSTASASVTVVAPPSISKSFGAASIPQNSSTSLSFTITNPNSTVSLTGVGFTDTLPAGLVVSTPNALMGSCGGGTITATPGTSSVSLSGATLAASGTCTFSVNVFATATGVKNNTTAAVTSNEGGMGNTASASLTVALPPSISKSFGATTFPLNGSTSLSFTITNPNSGLALTGVAFTDSLPGGLVVASPSGLTGSCGGGMISAASGTVSLTGATLAASGSCMFAVNVTGTTSGIKSNTTNPVTSNEGGTGNSATAAVTVIAPPLFSKFFGASTIALNASTSLSFTIINSNDSVSLNGVGFTDAFPAGLVVSTPNNLTGSCGGGTITATAGSSMVTLTGASIPRDDACTFSVSVTATSGGTKNNITGVVTSTNGGNGGTASASVSVLQPPSMSKSFGVSSIQVGSPTSLSFTVTNPNTGAALSGVNFTDTLPSGLTVSTPNGLMGNCGGGTITATAGSATVSLAGATIAASASCTFSVNVTAVDDGVQNNSVTPSSTTAGAGSPATASITTFRVPTITKAFGSAQIFQGQTTALMLSLNSPNHNLTLTGVAFSDTMPAGLVIATPSGESTTCAGTVTAVAGGNSISLTGSALSPGQTCTVTVNVTALDSGTLTNTTSALTSDQATPGDAATANLAVFATLDAPFQVSYAANPSAGESYINLVNDGANGDGLLGPGFGARTGNICVNAYAFSPDEQLISCCSCLLTPNAVANLGVNRDLTSTTLTGVIPTSVVVKLVATQPTGANCNNSASTMGTLVNGLVAYGSTPQPAGAMYSAVERTFTPSSLSASEYASISGRCASIVGNGSGFGICNSCKSGALGAQKQ